MQRASTPLTLFVRLEFAWRQWPDDRAYSIPKSVYGCPEQSVNEWVEGYIIIKIEMVRNMALIEKTLGRLTQENNLYTSGPIQSDGYRLSFCSKKKHSETGDINRDAEWPRGNYAIFKHRFNVCPEGKRTV